MEVDTDPSLRTLLDLSFSLCCGVVFIGIVVVCVLIVCENTDNNREEDHGERESTIP